MLHFRPSNLRLPIDPIWPSVDVKTPNTVFSERPPLRTLIVAIDHEIADQATDDLDDELGLLVGLLSHDFITTLLYADAGPPAGTPRHTSPIGDSVPGWLVVDAPSDDGFSYPVVRSDGQHIMQSAFLGDHVRAAESDATNPAYAEGTPEQAAQRRRADAIAIRAAFAAGADLFITSRPYLHAVTWDLSSGVLVAGPEDALAVVALYLRTQGVFDTYRSLDGHAVSSVNRGLFYWIATRSLLPAGWRWFAACRQHAGDDTSLAYLSQSAFTRVQRALEARDAVHRALNQPQHNDTAELALSNLDVVLITLMGGLDVSARIAHLTLQLPANRTFSAGWQNPTWLEAAVAAEPALAEVFAPEGWNTTVVRVLGRLRNAVHAAAPAPLSVSTPGVGRQATMVSFPHTDGEQLAGWMDRLGGRDAWGMTSVLSGRYHADPSALLEQLFPAAVAVIDRTMAATPVERLPGVHLTTEHCEPSKREEFAPWQRASIVRQLALGPPPPHTLL
jgi:hypothetical protein